MDVVRVMVVDDQPPFRQAAAAVVDSMDGFTVVATAETGEDALALLQTVPVDLVLMDVVMPGMGGLAGARALVGQDDAPVVVLLSTYDDVDLGEGVDTCGAASYLSKSAFDADELRAIWHGQRP